VTPNDPNNYRFDIQSPVYVVYAPPQNRGERNNQPTPEELTRLQSYEVRIGNNNERWNRYRILRTGHTIRLRLTATEIRRVTDRFDNDGLPFYLVTAGPAVALTEPRDGLQPWSSAFRRHKRTSRTIGTTEYTKDQENLVNKC
jgi:hypothetical protein